MARLSNTTIYGTDKDVKRVLAIIFVVKSTASVPGRIG